MKSIKTLEPTIVWDIFDQILKVPRQSKKEEQIQQFLLNFASKYSLEAKQDTKGNIVIIKSATNGYESCEGIVLQSHMDMVCEKEADSSHDFLTDPIQAYVDTEEDAEEWVKAKGTTLGADCGIGMALALAVLIDKTLEHPTIEALFTVDEEQGLSGAKELDSNILSGKYLINLDSEDEGEIFIGCAGGIDTIATFDTPIVEAPKGETYTIIVSNLLGGHSGDDINKERACATKIIARLLYQLLEMDVSIVTIDAGNLRNAIARDGIARIVISSEKSEKIIALFNNFAEQIKQEYTISDPNINIEIEKVEPSTIIIDTESARRLILTLMAIPHGVIAMSSQMIGMVETSTNLASIKQQQDKTVVTTSQRSSSESAKQYIANAIKSLFLLANAEVQQSEGYPGWNPVPNNKLTQIADTVYQQTFKKTPQIKTIHAGLECGLIIDKYPSMEAISIGPTLRGVHSPSEKLKVKTVAEVWVFIEKLIKKVH